MFAENPLTFTQVIVWKQKYGWTEDRHMDDLPETIYPTTIVVLGYKNLYDNPIFSTNNALHAG